MSRNIATLLIALSLLGSALPAAHASELFPSWAQQDPLTPPNSFLSAAIAYPGGPGGELDLFAIRRPTASPYLFVHRDWRTEPYGLSRLVSAAFSSPLPTIAAPRSIATADVDEDGNLDVVFIVPGRIMIATGITDLPGGTITIPLTGVDAVGTGDLDGDLLPDLVAHETSTGSIHLFHNDGLGVFSQTATFAWAGAVSGITVRDDDRDGDTDLLLFLPSGNGRTLLDSGGGVFVVAGQIPAGAIATPDLNGDGFPDVVAPTGPYLNDGAGGYVIGPEFGQPLQSMAVVDYDADGVTDIVGQLAGAPPRLGAYRGVGDGGFRDVVISPMPTSANVIVTGGDFDGDGITDVVIAGTTDQLMRGNGLGTFGRSAPAHALHSPADRVRGGRFASSSPRDLLLLRESTHALTARPYLGTVGWGAGDSTIAPGTPEEFGPVVGDLDGDGDDEIVLGYTDLNQITIWRPGPTGVFASPQVLTTPTPAYAVTLGDIDSDGRLDLLYAPRPTPGAPVRWFRNTSNSVYDDKGTLDVSTNLGMCVADVNGDGWNDVVTSQLNGPPRVMLATGPGAAFGVPFDLPTSFTNALLAFATGDLDGDGYTDLIALRAGATEFYAGPLSNSSVPLTLTGAPTFGYGTQAVDLDADGRAELVQGTRVWRWSAAQGAAAPGATFAIATLEAVEGAVMDLNGDGFRDLVVAVPGVPEVRALTNQAPVFLAVPPAPRPGAAGLSLAPRANPVRGSLRVALASPRTGGIDLQLFDVAGRLVRSQRVAAGADVAFGDTRSLAPGLYLIHARQGDASATSRVVVLR